MDRYIGELERETLLHVRQSLVSISHNIKSEIHSLDKNLISIESIKAACDSFGEMKNNQLVLR